VRSSTVLSIGPPDGDDGILHVRSPVRGALLATAKGGQSEGRGNGTVYADPKMDASRKMDASLVPVRLTRPPSDEGRTCRGGHGDTHCGFVIETAPHIENKFLCA
jgi:hypothetical protein